MTTYSSWFVLQNGHGTWRVFLDAHPLGDPMDVTDQKSTDQILGSLNLLQWEVYLGSGKINNGYLSALPMPDQQGQEPGGSGEKMSTEDPR